MAEKLYGIDVIRGENEAEVLLYNTIGDGFDWWTGEEMISAKNFLMALKDLEAESAQINLRINCPGGSVFEGNAIVNAIKNSKANIVAYNDGVAASMAAVIFAAAPERHMAKNALLMIHGGHGIVVGTANDMRETADAMDKWNSTAVAEFEAVMTDKKKAKQMVMDGKDHWLSLEDVIDLGMTVNAEPEADNAPEPGTAQMNYRDFVKAFAQRNQEGDRAATRATTRVAPTAAAPNYFQRLVNEVKKAITGEKEQPIESPKNTVEMDLNEFKKSIEDGVLSVDEVLAHLNAQVIPAPEPEPVIAETPSEIEALTARLGELEASLAALKKVTPAAKITNVLSEGDHYTDEEKTAMSKKEEFERIARAQAGK